MSESQARFTDSSGNTTYLAYEAGREDEPGSWVKFLEIGE